MALTGTQITAAMTKDDLSFKPVSPTGFAANQLIKIEQEYMVQNGPTTAGGVVNVYKRGAEGTAVVPHAALATVVTSALPSDFPAVAPGLVGMQPQTVDDLVSYSVNGAIALPTSVKNRTVLLTKAGVAAMTLADPPKSLDGVRMTIMAQTAQANTVTYATGFNGSGGAGDVGTFGGAIGDNIVIQADNGIWNVISAKNVAIA